MKTNFIHTKFEFSLPQLMNFIHTKLNHVLSSFQKIISFFFNLILFSESLRELNSFRERGEET